jgi:hypothetical protein
VDFGQTFARPAPYRKVVALRNAGLDGLVVRDVRIEAAPGTPLELVAGGAPGARALDPAGGAEPEMTVEVVWTAATPGRVEGTLVVDADDRRDKLLCIDRRTGQMEERRPEVVKERGDIRKNHEDAQSTLEYFLRGLVEGELILHIADPDAVDAHVGGDEDEETEERQLDDTTATG